MMILEILLGVLTVFFVILSCTMLLVGIKEYIECRNWRSPIGSFLIIGLTGFITSLGSSIKLFLALTVIGLIIVSIKVIVFKVKKKRQKGQLSKVKNNKKVTKKIKRTNAKAKKQ
jgi:4-amino-4-deoxy-L-arabinose transferase-like glycosyltransferase